VRDVIMNGIQEPRNYRSAARVVKTSTGTKREQILREGIRLTLSNMLQEKQNEKMEGRYK